MKIEELKAVTDLEKLKTLGSIVDISCAINEIISPLKIESKTYEELFEVLQCLFNKWSDFKNDPFLNEKAEYTFYLTKLDGKQRNKLLGITDEMYESPELAKQWYKKIAKLVHPDMGIDETSKAFITLKKIYEIMIDNSEEASDEK